MAKWEITEDVFQNNVIKSNHECKNNQFQQAIPTRI